MRCTHTHPEQVGDLLDLWTRLPPNIVSDCDTHPVAVMNERIHRSRREAVAGAAVPQLLLMVYTRLPDHACP